MPTIMQPRVRIPGTLSMLCFCHLNLKCNVKGTKINKMRPGLAHMYLKVGPSYLILANVGAFDVLDRDELFARLRPVD